MNDKTEQTTANALPCPFCGSTEGFYVEEGSTFRWRVISCRNCGEGTEVRHKNNSNEAHSYITDWNAAAPYPVMLRKEINTLRAQLAEAQRDAELWDHIERHACSIEAVGGGTRIELSAQPSIAGGLVRIALQAMIERAAIDAAKGGSNA